MKVAQERPKFEFFPVKAIELGKKFATAHVTVFAPETCIPIPLPKPAFEDISATVL